MTTKNESDTHSSIVPVSTLHALSLPPSLWNSFMPQMIAVWQENDGLILLGMAAQGISDSRLNDLFISKLLTTKNTSSNNLYLLQNDINSLGFTAEPTHYQIIDYAQWAHLIIKYSRHLSWK